MAEIARLAVHLGGRAETVSGLSGVGDLMLTCSGAASRNFRLGLAIGRGTPPAQARASIGAAVEGMDAAPALLDRAGDVACPITAALVDVLHERMDVATAMAALLSRPEAEE